MRYLTALTVLMAAGMTAAEDLVQADARGLKKVIAEAEASVVVVNFWASWCLPCRVEFPELTKLHRQWNDRGVHVIFISTDFDDSLDNARQFLKQQKVDWTNYLARDRDQVLIDSFDREWSGSLPATFVYDRERRRVTAFHRPVTYEQLTEAVRKAGAARQQE